MTLVDAQNVTTEELLDKTVSYVGQKVSIRSEVEETVSESTFFIADEDYFEGESVLVINASGEVLLYLMWVRAKSK